jgi:hypothetical protein
MPLSGKGAFQKLLTWLAFAVLPFTLEQLWEAIAIKLDTDCIDDEFRLRSPEDILSLGNSLIIMAQYGEHVKLAHLSVRDYLMSDTIHQDREVFQFL